jgi:hypothetical protein
MPLPAGVETVTVTSGEPLTLPNGAFMQGRLLFTGPDLVTIGADDVVLGGTVEAPLVDGEFSITLCATDATGMNPTGWTYKVTTRFTNAPNWIRHVSLPKATSSVKLADILNADPVAASYAVFADVEAIGLDTGVASGGELNANVSNPLALDISATVGYVVDYVTTPTSPLVTRVSIAAQTVALTDTVGVLTWWMADSAGIIIQQSTRPTNTQRRTHLQLGVTALIDGAIAIDQTLPVILPQPTNQLYDLFYALGSFSIDGNTLTAAGANLQIAKAAGTVFATSFNHFAGPTLTNDPHVSFTAAQNPTALRYATRTLAAAVPTVTNVDVANYDNAGVITAVGGGANRATIQRVYLFPVNATTDQVVVQYGQTIYSDLSSAVAAVGADSFVQNPTLSDGVLLGFIVAIRTATNLSDTTQARVIMAGKFGSGPAGSTSAVAGSANATAQVRITDDSLVANWAEPGATWTIAQTSAATKLQCSIAAAAGDRVELFPNFMRAGGFYMDWALLTAAGAISVFASTESASEPPEGNPALYPSLSFSYVTSADMFTVGAEHISGGLITIALVYRGTGGGRAYAHTTYPFRLRLKNIDAEPA